MANNRATPLKVIAMRAIRLDVDGNIDAGANNQVVLRAPVQILWTPDNPDRETFDQLDGDGVECVKYEGPPKPATSHALSMQLCQLDFELLELLIGGSIVTDGGDTIGYLDATQDTINEFGVVFEAWQRVFAGSQALSIGGNTQALRHIWPLTRWQISDQQTMENGLTITTVSGIGTPNAQIGDGLDGDPFPSVIGDSAHGEAFVDLSTVPADTGGYATVVDVGS